MVNLTIDNINVSVPEGTTIMDAAKMADIPIPKLCYLKDINEIAACRVCVVVATFIIMVYSKVLFGGSQSSSCSWYK